MDVASFVEALQGIDAPAGCVNPYRGFAEGIDAHPGAADARARQLAAYLDARVGAARLILVAEAPGYQGARFSGIAMTCERTLLGHKPCVAPRDVLGGERVARTSVREIGRNRMERQAGFSEPTASVVWRELTARPGATRAVVLWNTYPLHPHKPGMPLSNRTPGEAEVKRQLAVLEAFLGLFPERDIVAVGETARRNLTRLGLEAAAVRHPANGGAGRFREGMRAVLDGLGAAGGRAAITGGRDGSAR